MTWEEIEIFCSDCIMKNICNEPCEDIVSKNVQYIASVKGMTGESIQGTYKAQKNKC